MDLGNRKSFTQSRITQDVCPYDLNRIATYTCCHGNNTIMYNHKCFCEWTDSALNII